MLLFELFLNYWRWHYSRAISDIFRIWGNFIWFLWNYFSIRQLVRTFFVPWRRLHEDSSGPFDFFNLFASVVITLLMRIIGVIVRSIVILFGLVSIVALLIGGLVFFVIWLFLPLIILILFAVGFQLASKGL